MRIPPGRPVKKTALLPMECPGRYCCATAQFPCIPTLRYALSARTYIFTAQRKIFTVAYIRLLRPKDWAKNLFLLIPLFFSGGFFHLDVYPKLLLGILAFCFMASSIYIINDYRDIEDDRKHPEKSKRPLASGAVSKTAALAICAVLVVAGFTIAWFIREKFLFVLAIYFFLNLGYSF